MADFLNATLPPRVCFVASPFFMLFTFLKTSGKTETEIFSSAITFISNLTYAVYCVVILLLRKNNEFCDAW